MSIAGPLISVQLLTIPETAARLRCSENHVYALIAAGRIRATDVARPGAGRPKTRVSERALAEYIESSAQ